MENQKKIIMIVVIIIALGFATFVFFKLRKIQRDKDKMLKLI